MVYVELARIGEGAARIGTKPFPFEDATAFFIQPYRRQAFLDEHFLAGILAVFVLVDPMAIELPVIVSGAGGGDSQGEKQQ